MSEPEKILADLLAGNQRFASGNSIHPHQDSERRTQLAEGQQPVAAVISCSDSRIPPELIFDQGLGDLFVIRLAGNIIDDLALGSIEYAVEHLNVKLVLVLGHTGCGAVGAAVSKLQTDTPLGSIVKAIQPAVETASHQEGDLHHNTMIANIKLSMSKLKAQFDPQNEKPLMITGAFYDLESGLVEVV